MRFIACLAILLAGACSSGTPMMLDLGGAPAGDGGGGSGVVLPGGSGGIMFDDLRFSSRLDRVVSPARSSGNVDLVDPVSFAVASIPGFGDAGSADEGGGFIFAVDRSAKRLAVADPAMKMVVASVAVASFPDYVRFVASTMEAWVTEPAAMGVEIFSLSGTPPVPAHAGFVSTPNGPEGLAIDVTRNRAYVHLDPGQIAAIDLTSRAIVATWPTGCNGSHGIPAVDEQRGFVFAGCSESARVAVLDAAHGGAILDSYTLGGGETLLGYSTSLHHFYLRGDPGIPTATLAVATTGKLSLLGTVTTAMAGHCVAADSHNAYWVCDAAAGRLLHFLDNLPATP